MAAIGLHCGTGIRGITGIAGHNGTATSINSCLESNKLIFLKRAFRRVEPPLTLSGVGFKAVFSSAVTGEMLYGKSNRTFLHAAFTILISLDKGGDNAGSHIGTLGIGFKVAWPAGIGNQVNLRTIHGIDALCYPHLTVNFGKFADGIIVAVAHDSCSHTLRIGEAGRDGVGDNRHRDVGNATQGSIGLRHLGYDVVVQCDSRSIKVQATTIYTGANLLGIDDEGVQPGKAVGVGILRFLTLCKNRNDSSRINGAIFIPG